MKVLKQGTIIRNEEGGLTFSGFVFDCEGGSVNLDEFIQFCKLIVDGEESK